MCQHGFIGPCAECDGSGQIPEPEIETSNPSEPLIWEGIRWAPVGPVTMPSPVKCDGCETLTKDGEGFAGNDGSRAFWCADCVETVKAEPVNR